MNSIVLCRWTKRPKPQRNLIALDGWELNFKISTELLEMQLGIMIHAWICVHRQTAEDMCYYLNKKGLHVCCTDDTVAEPHTLARNKLKTHI
jgi:hypothetical protein